LALTGDCPTGGSHGTIRGEEQRHLPAVDGFQGLSAPQALSFQPRRTDEVIPGWQASMLSEPDSYPAEVESVTDV
jgi:hypothetical protein